MEASEDAVSWRGESVIPERIQRSIVFVSVPARPLGQEKPKFFISMLPFEAFEDSAGKL